MQAETIIYGAVALSVSIWLGTLAAFFWSERRWRKREQWLASLCTRPLDAPGIPRHPADDAERPTIPITRRPFHEALWEDEPDLAPSPRLRAFLQRSGDQIETGGRLGTGAGAPGPDALARIESVHEENDEMKWNQMFAVAALATAGTLSACAQTPPRPKPRHNPNPTQRYQITMTIANAPGPFASIEGIAQYDTVNYNECGVRNESSGIFHDLTENVPITFARVSDTRYTATVYLDGMLDEDYHGRGACLWKLTDVRAVLKATGAEVETSFFPHLSPENMLDGRAVRIYFRKELYPRSSVMDAAHSSGQAERSRFGPSITDADLFTITWASREVTP